MNMIPKMILFDYEQIFYEETKQVFLDTMETDKSLPIQELLDFLYENHIRTAIISNIRISEASLREKIERLIPGHHFEFILTSNEGFVQKQNKKIFSLALEKAGIEPQETWYVGGNDVTEAKNAGIFSKVFTVYHWKEQIEFLKLSDEKIKFENQICRETHREKAKRLFYSGFNCCQSVFAAYADVYGMDEEMALRISASFGGGIGRMREVCGCASGMFLIAGLETGSVAEHDREGKMRNYEMVQKLAELYKQRNGGNSIICRELLGLEKAEGSPKPAERTDEYYKKRPCPALIQEACAIIEEIFPKCRDELQETEGR